MNITVPFVRLAMVAFAASITSPFLTVDAMAAKETFERNKPHVNVGTIGHVDQDKSSQIETGNNGTTSLQSGNPGDQDCNATNSAGKPTC
jgi:GTPase